MTDLQPEQFDDFFQQLYPYPPMTWQSELAVAACSGEWPDYICLPTGAGKTSVIDIALFALAFQADLPSAKRTAPMRTFLVVDRRTVVSEAFYRATALQEKLDAAQDGVLKLVADRLRSYSGGETAMAIAQLRGGIYRDRNWCGSLTQPMVVTSTVDQVGSRLLFRGYGVSNLARPIQAAAVAFDSLIVLDEAHISPAFSETLSYVRQYQQAPWCEQSLPRALRVVEMTATPPAESSATKLEIEPEELNDTSTHIGRIVNTAKTTSLVVADKVKGAKGANQLASVLVEQALARVQSSDEGSDDDAKVACIMCNTVATAKATVEGLLKQKAISSDQVHLIIGAMRPIDRDTQTDELRRLIATGANRNAIDKRLFVVATQCIEVGADYDFDVLVTEAAPLDSLIQRFGRLNRAGRPIAAAGCIVMRGDYLMTDKQLEDADAGFKFVDPIYGNRTSHTWNWLVSVADEQQMDFGIANIKRFAERLDDAPRSRLVSSQTAAPVLLPAHLDMLCQTSQDPWPDPDIALWLHGPQRNDPEVQICWRGDLLPPTSPSTEHADAVRLSLAPLKYAEHHKQLIHAISLCPPSSAECLSIPMRRVIGWLKSLAKGRRTEADLTGDVPQFVDDTQSESERIPFPFRPIAWRGLEKSAVITDVNDIRPGDTLILSTLSGGWSELGYVPGFNDWHCRDEHGNHLANRLLSLDETNATEVLCNADDFQRLAELDVASRAFRQSRRRPIARLHPNLIFAAECKPLFNELREQQEDYRLNKFELRDLLSALPADYSEGFADARLKQMQAEFYGNLAGIVVTGPLLVDDARFALLGDDESDGYSQICAGDPIELTEHLERVRAEAAVTVSKLALDTVGQTIAQAAAAHDWGKADERFQALLLGSDVTAAVWEGRLYAKSAELALSLNEREAARQRAGLPSRFRHEMLSLALTEAHRDRFTDIEDGDLLLHLIASHHGYARPWAPLCADDEPPEVSLDLLGMTDVMLSTADRQSHVYHRVDSGVPERFWRVTRRYGWWGAAWLEAVLRLADHHVSRIESLQQNQRLHDTSREPTGV